MTATFFDDLVILCALCNICMFGFLIRRSAGWRFDGFGIVIL